MIRNMSEDNLRPIVDGINSRIFSLTILYLDMVLNPNRLRRATN